MAQVREGAKAPKFSLQDKDGKSYGVGKSKTDFTVLYFYPKDDTPGCTLEAKEFSKNLKSFMSRNAAVIGVSGGDNKSKEKFCKKYKLEVPLLSDSDFAVSRAYGVYGDKKFMGRVYKGIHRKTFIVDKAGVVARIFDSVKPEGHAEEVLEALDSLRKSGGTAKAEMKAPAAKKARVAAKSKKAAPAKKRAVSAKAKAKPSRRAARR
jgi:peroxiredoxin Q/BCP